MENIDDIVEKGLIEQLLTDLNAKYLLKKHYGIDMQEGIYKITRSGDRIMLTLT